MARSLALFAIGLSLGGGIGFFLAAANSVALDGHRHGPEASAAHPGHGAAIELPAGPAAPTLDLQLAKDAKSGWNLHIATTNFRFAPERASRANRAGEGHAHVYVDGRKIARLYGPWFHLDGLPPGKAEIAVTLIANDHSDLAVAGRPLRAGKTIGVPAPVFSK